MLKQRAILSKLFWDKRENPENYDLVFIHRGAPKDKKTISCSDIIQTAKSWFTYSSENLETTIPFHRILEIRNKKTGECVWRKRTKFSQTAQSP
ncbi:MAG: RNA repair domain-containing protein [Candidatus Bathyarchaeia archaeon]